MVDAHRQDETNSADAYKGIVLRMDGGTQTLPPWPSSQVSTSGQRTQRNEHPHFPCLQPLKPFGTRHEQWPTPRQLESKVQTLQQISFRTFRHETVNFQNLNVSGCLLVFKLRWLAYINSTVPSAQYDALDRNVKGKGVKLFSPTVIQQSISNRCKTVFIISRSLKMGEFLQ